MTLCELLSTALQQACGLPEEAAAEAAVKVIAWGAENGHASTEHYWPARATLLSPDDRDAMIRKEFTGSNLKTICKRYGVSKTTVYRIVHSI